MKLNDRQIRLLALAGFLLLLLILMFVAKANSQDLRAPAQAGSPTIAEVGKNTETGADSEDVVVKSAKKSEIEALLPEPPTVFFLDGAQFAPGKADLNPTVTMALDRLPNAFIYIMAKRDSVRWRWVEALGVSRARKDKMNDSCDVVVTNQRVAAAATYLVTKRGFDSRKITTGVVYGPEKTRSLEATVHAEKLDQREILQRAMQIAEIVADGKNGYDGVELEAEVKLLRNELATLKAEVQALREEKTPYDEESITAQKKSSVFVGGGFSRKALVAGGGIKVSPASWLSVTAFGGVHSYSNFSFTPPTSTTEMARTGDNMTWAHRFNPGGMSIAQKTTPFIGGMLQIQF